MFDTLYDSICRQLNSSPSHICIIWTDSNGNPIKIDSAALLNAIQSYTILLQKAYSTQNGKVLIAATPSPEIIAAILAIIHLSNSAVLPPAGVSIWSIVRMIRRYKIRQIVTNKNLSAGLLLLSRLFRIKILYTDSKLLYTKNLQPPNKYPHIKNGEGGLVTHSSGSTGIPKKIERPGHILYAQHLALKKSFPPQKGQIDFPLFPNVVLHNLACGVTSVLPDIPDFDVTKMDPEKIIRQIHREKVQTLTGNTFYFKQLIKYLQQEPQPLFNVQALGIGGSPVPENLMLELRSYFPNAAIFIIYGSSEAEPIAIRKYNAASVICDGYNVGEIYEGLKVRIDIIGEILLSNGILQPVGEVAVKGSHVAISPQKQWLFTGDYGYISCDNQLYLTGRKGNEQIHNNVQHYQIEHCLLQLPYIENIAAKSDTDGFTLFVKGNVDEGNITQILYRQFEKIKLNGIIFQPELPLDRRHHSKIRYELLK